MTEHLDDRACAQAETAIGDALLGACVISSVATTVSEDGSIEINAIRLRLRDGRAVRIRVVDYNEGWISIESVESSRLRRMMARDFPIPDPSMRDPGDLAPHYRPADRCCATCNNSCCIEGAHAWYCDKYARRPVCEGSVCDSWVEKDEEAV